MVRRNCPKPAIPPVIPSVHEGKLSDELYSACMEKAKENAGPGATSWIHLADAVSRGTISPMEAYDAIEAGFLPETLKVRKSLYYHLL
jgi:hypothetical protein